MAEINEILSKEAIEGIRQADTAISKFDESMLKVLSTSKQVDALFKNVNMSFAEVKNLSEKTATATKQLADAQEKLSAAEKQALSLKEKLTQLDTEAGRKTAANTQALKQKIAATNLDVKATNDLLGAYAKLSAQVEIARKKYQNIAADLGATSKEAKNARKEFEELHNKQNDINRNLGNYTDNVGNYNSIWGKLKDTVMKFGGVLLGALAVDKVIEFGKASFEAYEKQEKANKQLLMALKGNQAAFTILSEQAKKFQEEAGVPDEEINKIQMLAAETGKSVDQIRKITEASINLSAATGKDLQSTYEMLNGTFAGASKGLKKLDADFGTLTATQLRNGAAIDMVNEKFGGLAAASATSTEKLNASWDEFKENFGKSFSGIILPLINSFNRALLQMQSTMSGKDFAKQAGVNYGGFFGGSEVKDEADRLAALQAKLAASGSKAEMMQAIEDTRKKLGFYSGEVGETMNRMYATFMSNVGGMVQDLDKQVNKVVSDTGSGMNKAASKTKDAYELLTASISDYDKQINAALTGGDSKLAASLENDRRKAVLLAEAIKRIKEAYDKGYAMGDDARKLASVLFMGSRTDGVQVKSGKASNPLAGLDKKDTKYNAGPSDNIVAQEEADKKYREDMQTMEFSGMQTLSDTIFSMAADRNQRIYEDKIAKLNAQMNAELANEHLTEKQKEAIKAKYAKKEAEIKKKQFRDQQRADIISSQINTALSIAKTFATLGYPAGIPMAILAGIVGTAQTVAIAAKKPPEFDKGTTHSPSDFIMAELRPEWMKTKGGQWRYIDRPTMFKNAPGSQIISGAETERMMRLGIAPNGVDPRAEIVHMENRLAQVIRDKREVHISRSGNSVYEIEAGNKKSYANSKVKWYE